MRSSTESFNHQDALFIVVLVIVAAGLLLVVSFAFQVFGDRGTSQRELVELRNQQLRAELAAGILSGRIAVVEAARVAARSMGSENRPSVILEHLQTATRSGRSHWYVLNALTWELHGLQDILPRGELLSAVPDILPGWDDSGRATVALFFRPDGAVEVCFLWQVPDHLDLIAVRQVTIDALTPLAVRIPTALQTRAEIVDRIGRVVMEVGWNSADSVQIGIPERTVNDPPGGFHPAKRRRTYIGPVSTALIAEELSLVQVSDAEFHSVLPIPGTASVLVIEDHFEPANRAKLRTYGTIAGVAAGIYVLLVVLFVGFRRTLVEQSALLSEASREKSVLFALLSHNLKNSLSTIAAETRAQIGSAGNDGAHLEVAVNDASRVVSNALYYLRWRDGSLPQPPCEAVTMDDLLEFARLRMERAIAARGDTIACSPVDQTSTAFTNLNVALEALEQVLHNAVYHTPPGTAIELSAREAGAERVEVLVHDSGPGIAEDKRSTLFQPMNLDPKANSSGSIRGIGLFVCRSLLATVHARIELATTGAHGSTFVISFPRYAAAARPERPLPGGAP